MQYLALSCCLTGLLLVIHLHEEVQRLGLLGFIEETSRVHFPLDGGVPVILHSIVGPAEKAEGNKSPLTAALKHTQQLQHPPQPHPESPTHKSPQATQQGRQQQVKRSYLPGSSLAISAQRFPRTLWASNMMRSSSSVHEDFFTSGFRWLCQRSRHCFPKRPFRCLAIRVHCLVPYFLTSSITFGESGREIRTWNKGGEGQYSHLQALLFASPGSR